MESDFNSFKPVHPPFAVEWLDKRKVQYSVFLCLNFKPFEEDIFLGTLLEIGRLAKCDDRS